MKRLFWLLVSIGILAHIFGGEAMKIQQKQEQMLFTVVTVEGSGSGSGVVVYSKDNFTLILTAKHVVKETDEVDITFYPNMEEHVGHVYKLSKKRDLALIVVEGYTHKYVATLSTDLKPQVYAEVWKVGAGMSHHPHPGVGIITGLPKNGIMHNAHTIFGDSGGGVFIQDALGQYHLTGIIVAVAMANKLAPLPHMGYAHDIATINRFLNNL